MPLVQMFRFFNLEYLEYLILHIQNIKYHTSRISNITYLKYLLSQACPDRAPPPYLQCSNCPLGFSDPWDLMEHVQVEKSDINMKYLPSIFAACTCPWDLMEHVQVGNSETKMCRRQILKTNISYDRACAGGEH